MREEMEKKIEKWQEPPPAKIDKPLPVPDQEPKKRRGGRRLRKLKERYGMTDVRKLQNRVNFNQVRFLTPATSVYLFSHAGGPDFLRISKCCP